MTVQPSDSYSEGFQLVLQYLRIAGLPLLLRATPGDKLGCFRGDESRADLPLQFKFSSPGLKDTNFDPQPLPRRLSLQIPAHVQLEVSYEQIIKLKPFWQRSSTQMLSDYYRSICWVVNFIARSVSIQFSFHKGISSCSWLLADDSSLVRRCSLMARVCLVRRYTLADRVLSVVTRAVLGFKITNSHKCEMDSRRARF